MEESEFSATAYDRVYDAERPEIFFKSLPDKVVGPGEPSASVATRGGTSRAGTRAGDQPPGRIVGFTIGNDMSSRDIEGENLLYLPQAKIYDRSCAVGPWITSAPLRRRRGVDDPAGDPAWRNSGFRRRDLRRPDQAPSRSWRAFSAAPRSSRTAQCCSQAPVSSRPTRSRSRPGTGAHHDSGIGTLENRSRSFDGIRRQQHGGLSSTTPAVGDWHPRCSPAPTRKSWIWTDGVAHLPRGRWPGWSTLPTTRATAFTTPRTLDTVAAASAFRLPRFAKPSGRFPATTHSTSRRRSTACRRVHATRRACAVPSSCDPAITGWATPGTDSGQRRRAARRGHGQHW